MNRPHTEDTACPRPGADRRHSPLLLGLLGGACALLALAVAPVACGGSGSVNQIGSGGGTGSGGRATGTGGGAGTGMGGAAGVAGSGGAGGGGASGGAGGGIASGGAGGGAAGVGGRSTGIGGGGGAGTSGSAGAGGRGAGGAGGGSACASAVTNAPCSTDNLVCGGPCTDVCQFCHLLVCTGGRWQDREAAPAPCFSCGTDRKCQTSRSSCQITSGGPVGAPTTYACLDLPAACVSAPTCACLAAGTVLSANVMRSCSQGTDGSLTTRLDYP